MNTPSISKMVGIGKINKRKWVAINKEKAVSIPYGMLTAK